MTVIRDVHMAINLAHRFIYFVPEGAEEAAAAGVTGRGAYFATRVAPLGAVPDEVIIATFYNFSPSAVRSVMGGVWAATTPAALQAARFRAAGRALARVGYSPSADDLAEARAIIDPVVAGLDLAGKPLAAANAAVALPEDPVLALWQQITVIREWRGDAHIAVLLAAGVGPCDCTVLQVGTGRAPAGMTRLTRQWTDDEWAAAVERLAARGWLSSDGELTDAGRTARDDIEEHTDRLCAPMWHGVAEASIVRLAELITPIHTAMDSAGTYAALR